MIQAPQFGTYAENPAHLRARRVRVFFRLVLGSIPEIVLHPPLHRKNEAQIKKPRAIQLIATELAPIRLLTGGFCEIRTRDLRIKSPLLYQLS